MSDKSKNAEFTDSSCLYDFYDLSTAVDLKNGAGAVYPGEPKEGKPGCTLTLSEENFIQLALGKLSGQQVNYQDTSSV